MWIPFVCAKKSQKHQLFTDYEHELIDVCCNCHENSSRRFVASSTIHGVPDSGMGSGHGNFTLILHLETDKVETNFIDIDIALSYVIYYTQPDQFARSFDL